MDILVVKIIALFTLCLLSLLAGSLPLLCLRRRSPRLKTLLLFCNCFSGGIFLGSFLLHLLPESQEKLKDVFPDEDFPVSEALVAAGFFLILLIECTALACYQTEHTSSQHNERSSLLCNENSSAVIEPAEEDVHEHGIIGDSSILRTVFFLLALSIHSLFEGFAIGLETSKKEALQLLLAIGIHKSLISLSFSFNLARQNMTILVQMIFLAIFSFSSPLGIGIAIALSENPNALLNGILQSLSAGTFLYVIFIEIVPSLNLHHHRGPLKALVMMVGFGVMIGLHYVE
ncbi:zinc transporter ZIP1-like [Anneissia japonica]|uniref:zinc transporter ZIP1-like n=1 Tax=Anneissia japonica TaxID=1529436 RepID=UPI0014254D24|nr:zinc transporter ZIP1-like [Anneissia japonica]